MAASGAGRGSQIRPSAQGWQAHGVRAGVAAGARSGCAPAQAGQAHGQGLVRADPGAGVQGRPHAGERLHASLQNIRTAVEHLRARGVSDLESITLMSDGASIYECTSPDEIVDLLHGGQGVFGIAIGKVWSEVEGSLATLQGESLSDGSLVVSGESNDELAQRRKLKGA